MDNDNASAGPLSRPGTASAENGNVFLDGPDGVALTLTPEAAIGTAQSLLEAAEVAKHQPRDEGA